MYKKVILAVFMAMLIVFGAGTTYANQVDGMASGTGPTLATGIQASVNPGALGDSLIYGYYNVRGNLNLFNIINTSPTDGAKVRVVFRNAKNSKEVLDFSVCLSKGDVWTAYLVDDGTQGRLYAYDTDTVTAPVIPATGQPFTSGTFAPFTITADDTREGYFEVVGLYSIPGYDKAACTAASIANNCPITEATCRDYTSIYSVGNVLMGNNTIFDSASLATYSYNATAIADFSTGVVALTPGTEPSLASMDNGCNEADYILMKSNVYSPYDILSSLGGETELILAFPTRLACHTNTSTSDMFNYTKTTGSYRIEFCTTFGLSIWNDQEKRQDVTSFSPSPSSCFPWELNVLRIGGSSIWNSTVATTAATTYTLGWLSLDLTGTGHTITYGGRISTGLPTIAYTTQSFLGGVASYMTPAAYKTTITNY